MVTGKMYYILIEKLCEAKVRNDNLMHLKLYKLNKFVYIRAKGKHIAMVILRSLFSEVDVKAYLYIYIYIFI